MHYRGLNYIFNYEMATKGYSVRIIAKDGYYWDYPSQEFINNTKIILAYLRNGVPLDTSHGSLRIIDEDLDGKSKVSQVVEIKIINN